MSHVLTKPIYAIQKQKKKPNKKTQIGMRKVWSLSFLFIP